ncbi:MAG: hypothetical protein JRI89_12505 [Deltaproteobacteria bacterium]|nr:hypothetical protein [Deltaproteobacteria bacterium]
MSLQTNGSAAIVHDFSKSSGDGEHPTGSLILSGSTLYGMTCYGGNNYGGIVFRIETDGSDYFIMHDFSGGLNDGKYPNGSLILSGSTLYGMTYYGGDSDMGVVFRIKTDGSGFSLLHEFTGGLNDGKYPNGSLILSGSTLYGMTYYGGDSDMGVVFRIKTDGSDYFIMHEFTGGGNDGSHPAGSLILSGFTLYGMTYYGGDSDMGVVFRIKTDGSGFSLLHEFTGGGNDGSHPAGSLIVSGPTLYGMTSEGGASDYGVVFRIETDGSGFSLLHEFSGGSNDGSLPPGSLILNGSTLYGMTNTGGDNDMGVVFRIKTDGSGFSLLHEFSGGDNDGAYPNDSLIISGSTLYGMTYYGGSWNNFGVLFSLPLSTMNPGGLFLLLLSK